ncbi:MAG: DUF1998 domain-containing protein [Firmicutes bacterium]|nr:DUF1998 domain-containing protein [Bacillota bacterium]
MASAKSTKNIMFRGVNQALYKYLPGSWVDFSQSGGGITYAVHVDRWNSVHLTGINNKRLLRVVNQRVGEFKSRSRDGAASVVNFSSLINEDTYYVLTPKISEQERAIVTSVKPWVFVCSSCGRVRQYYSYAEFKRRENEACDACGKHMTQLRMIRFCKCGYADGIFVPKCRNADHGTKYMTRRGSSVDFVCKKCGQKADVPFSCPDCKQKLSIKSALDSAHYFPFTLSLIDLLDKRKDVFLDNEEEGRGEKVVIGQYLGLIPQEEYADIIAKGSITQEDEFEAALQKEADNLRLGGLDDATIAMVMDAKRRANPSGKIYEAIAQVGQGLAVVNADDITSIAEEVLEYDELVHAKVVLSLQEAERDAEIVKDGMKPDYTGLAKALGFANVQICSGVPVIFAAYGYTRKEREPLEGVRLHGFPQEMEKKNIYATRLETEGVLFELDRRRVLTWLVENRLIEKEDLPQDMSDFGIKMWFLDRVHLDRITPFCAIDESDACGAITKRVYTLIHSISHALINEASEICGLDKSSLSEYILPNVPAVFLYCSNAQGFNMGALYSAFQSHFDLWLKRAKERTEKCIFDLICINKEKACVGCLYLNEVSCQHFNKDLDRGYLCGYYDKQKQEKQTGFWED